MSVLSAPFAKFIAVTKSDTINFFEMTRSLYIGGAGDVTVLGMDGNPVTFSAVPAGTILPIRVLRVYATGSTATNIVAMF